MRLMNSLTNWLNTSCGIDSVKRDSGYLTLLVKLLAGFLDFPSPQALVLFSLLLPPYVRCNERQ
jgi:hypothetical protein